MSHPSYELERSDENFSIKVLEFVADSEYVVKKKTIAGTKYIPTYIQMYIHT